MASWNGLDFIILIIFALNVVLGMTRGAMREMVSLLSLSVSLIIMIRFTLPLSNFLNRSPLINNMVNNQWTRNFMEAIGAGPLTVDLLNQIFYSIALLICFVGTFSIVDAGMARTGFVTTFSFPFAAWNSKVGGALGFVRGYVINLIMLLILTLHIFNTNSTNFVKQDFFTNSFFAKLYRNATIKLDAIITGRNPDQYREIFQDKNLYSPEMLEKQLNPNIPIPAPPGSQIQPGGNPAATPTAPQPAPAPAINPY